MKALYATLVSSSKVIPFFTEPLTKVFQTPYFTTGSFVRFKTCYYAIVLGERTPAHRVLKLAVGARHRCPPAPSWRQPCGRACDTWLKSLMHSGTAIQSQWGSAVQHGYGHMAQRLFQTREYNDVLWGPKQKSNMAS